MGQAVSLLEPVVGTNPTGDSLLNDQHAYLLEEDFGRLLEQAGNSADSGAIRDWEDIARRAGELLERSKHLQAAYYWASARLVCDGLPGLVSGLDLIQNLCVRYWTELHPKPARGDAVGTQRITWLNSLAHPGQYGRLVRERTLFVPEDGPAITLGDVAVAEQLRAAPEGTQPRTSGEIRALFAQHLEADAEARQIVGQLRQAAESVAALMADVRRLTDGKANLQLDPLKRLLDAAVRVLGGGSTPSTPAAAGATAGPADAPAAGDGAANLAAAPSNAAGIEAARASLRGLISFFERAEPSSPVPLILRRAERLIGRSFVDCLADLGGSLESVNLVVSGQAAEAKDD